MPKITTERRTYYKAKIRSIMSQNPQISQVAICERLKTEGLTLDLKYLGSLISAIHVERIKRLNTMTLNYALASFEDTMSEVVKVAWSIANNEFARNQDRVMALKEIREAHNAVFEKLFDAGVFERKLGTLDATIRNTPLPEDRKQAIRAVFTNWGLLPANDKELPVEVDSAIVVKEDAKPEPNPTV